MKTVLFLDDGGVLSDNTRRGAQWRRHLGEFLSREVGGEAATWGHANVPVFERAWAQWLEAMRDGKRLRDAMREYDLFWVRGMAERVGVALPADEAHVIELARRTVRHVTERVRAFYPDVLPAVRALHARGYALHTASGALEADLDGYLRAEGVRELFGTLYGTDIVDIWKDGPAYYVAIFAHAGVDPHDAVVVDDSQSAVEWARSIGANVFLLDRSSTTGRNTLRSLADLKRALA